MRDCAREVAGKDVVNEDVYLQNTTTNNGRQELHQKAFDISFFSMRAVKWGENRSPNAWIWQEQNLQYTWQNQHPAETLTYILEEWVE